MTVSPGFSVNCKLILRRGITIKQQPIEELWELIYESFNRINEAFEMPAIIGSTQSSKDVEYRLMKSISLLKSKDNSLDRIKILNSVQADILLSETMGWITSDISWQTQALLKKIGDA